MALLALASASCGDEDEAPANGDGGAVTASGLRSGVPAPPGEEAPDAPPDVVKLSADLQPIADLIGQQQVEPARALLARYREAHPLDGQAEFLLGLTYHREKRYGLARPHFERALKLAPDYATIHHFLGWCLYNLGEAGAARRAFEAHLARAPGEGDSHFALGLIDLDENRLDDAEHRFLEAIRLQQDIPRRKREVSKAHARLADVYMVRGDLAAARLHLENSTRLWPEHYTAFYKLYRVLTRLGEDDAARAALEQHRYWQQVAQERRGVPEPGR